MTFAILVFSLCNIFSYNQQAVGFDCEWVFWGERLPVALIQIATYDGLCLLVRIYQMSDDIPASLRKFLNDKRYEKLKIEIANFILVYVNIENKTLPSKF